MIEDVAGIMTGAFLASAELFLINTGGVITGGSGSERFPIRVKSGFSPMAWGWLVPSDWLMQLVNDTVAPTAGYSSRRRCA